MNFLAHLYLSGNDDEIMVGNFIGDFVKGKNLLERFDPGYVKGIELHRTIDDFTDNHPIVSQSKNRLRGRYHHYSAVIVDMFYDHFLASHWSSFHPLLLKDFTKQAYATIMEHESVLPDEVLRMLSYMRRDNWLLAYARIEGIHQALTGMARRTTFESRMDEAVRDLMENYESFEKEFLLFFPDLKNHAHDFLQS